MSLKKFGLIFFSIAMFFACSKKIPATQTVKKAENVSVKNAPTPPVSNPALDVRDVMEQNLVAMLKRTPCFGKCPSYEVKVYDNGRAIYTGFAFVPRIGKFEAIVPATFINRLQKEAVKNGYTTLLTKYPSDDSAIKDLPTTITFLRSGKKGNRVENNYDAPKELIEFENWFENEIQNMDWKQVK